MTLLTPSALEGRVAWLGIVPEDGADLSARPVDAVEATWEGFAGDRHSGLTRPACVRVKRQHPAGTAIRNTRQVSILSTDEMAEIARRLGLPALDPAWLGASLVLEGIPDLTGLPPVSRLIFANGATLTTDTENGPCRGPGKLIEAAHPGHGMAFAMQAQGLRGLTGWVERPGRIALGDRCRLHLPPRRVWAGWDAARP